MVSGWVKVGGEKGTSYLDQSQQRSHGPAGRVSPFGYSCALLRSHAVHHVFLSTHMVPNSRHTRGIQRATQTEVNLMSVLTRFSTEFTQGTRHKYIFLSRPTDATNSPEGEKRIARIASSCCRCCPMGLPVVASQKRTVLSHDALARINPSGERERESTKLV